MSSLYSLVGREDIKIYEKFLQHAKEQFQSDL